MKQKEKQIKYSPLLRNVTEKAEPFLYLLPFLIGVLIFVLYPVVNVFLMSFKEKYSFLTKEYAGWGIENYKQIFSDIHFRNAIINTLIYVIFVVPVSTALAVVIATLLNSKVKGIAVFQTAYFMPMVTCITAVGLVWRLMYNKQYGIINFVLGLFKIPPVGWVDDSKFSMAALIIFGIWNILPFTVILLLSGIQNIDETYYTAAKVDGASSVRIFFRITVPLLSPTIFLVSVINTISCFKVFSELYPLFNGKPGPYYNLYTVVYYIRYAMMEKHQYGLAAAAAVVLFVFILVFTLIQQTFKKWMGRRGL